MMYYFFLWPDELIQNDRRGPQNLPEFIAYQVSTIPMNRKWKWFRLKLVYSFNNIPPRIDHKIYMFAFNTTLRKIVALASMS